MSNIQKANNLKQSAYSSLYCGNYEEAEQIMYNYRDCMTDAAWDANPVGGNEKYLAIAEDNCAQFYCDMAKRHNVFDFEEAICRAKYASGHYLMVLKDAYPKKLQYQYAQDYMSAIQREYNICQAAEKAGITSCPELVLDKIASERIRIKSEYNFDV